ncbi:MAG: DNA mismatch repair endonuclease MutL [Lachnospiraceae bacterium]|nr:DNA mismatch repair endonuclease MutL [Lachnospiraceae bacterium]
MAVIHVLDSATIDKIAAGEVVERPVSVVKELVENAIDAGATHVCVEIKDGGVSMIRVTDDGSGIEKSELGKVFYRHATSKIETAEDLSSIHSLGFRGEALSSISAVGQVELITKTADDLVGSRLLIAGGSLEEPEEVGAPTGTTIVVRNLFFNTPVRKKFLKSPTTEGNYISEYMQHLALSSPGVAFQFVSNGQTRFFTSGNGDMKEIIYRIYGKDVSTQLLPFAATMEGVVVRGFLGRPILARANRSYETFFVNGRYIKSALLSSAVEEGYRTLLMQHKYPFVVLHFSIDPQRLDVNVHPTKLDIRISDPGELLKFLADSVAQTLAGKSLIQPEAPELTAAEKKEESMERRQEAKQLTDQIPQPFEQHRRVEDPTRQEAQDRGAAVQESAGLATTGQGATVRTDQKAAPTDNIENDIVEEKEEEIFGSGEKEDANAGSEQKEDASADSGRKEAESAPKKTVLSEASSYDISRLLGKPGEKAGMPRESNVIKQKDMVLVQKPVQMELFDEVDIRKQEIENFRIVGQIFDTYWILALGDKIYYVDQHAAHEKVMYERLMEHYREKDVFSEPLSPPLIMTLTPKECEILEEYQKDFSKLGFETEHFGENTYALRGVPMDLYGSGEKELFLSVLDALAEGVGRKDPDVILFKIASMSCKAAIKGGQNISEEEARALIKEMLACDNPYHCPHGRPTMISVSRQEMEKKFHR